MVAFCDRDVVARVQQKVKFGKFFDTCLAVYLIPVDKIYRNHCPIYLLRFVEVHLRTVSIFRTVSAMRETAIDS